MSGWNQVISAEIALLCTERTINPTDCDLLVLDQERRTGRREVPGG